MNTSRWSARVALVTGGMGGIGRGIALALAKRDFDVVGADRQIDAARADELRSEIQAPTRLATMAAGDLPFTTGAAIQVDGAMHIQYY